MYDKRGWMLQVKKFKERLFYYHTRMNKSINAAFAHSIDEEGKSKKF